MANSDHLLYEASDSAAAEWYRLALATPHTLTLWWRKAEPGEQICVLAVAANSPGKAYEASITISRAWSRQQAKVKIFEAIRDLPVLGKATV